MRDQNYITLVFIIAAGTIVFIFEGAEPLWAKFVLFGVLLAM